MADERVVTGELVSGTASAAFAPDVAHASAPPVSKMAMPWPFGTESAPFKGYVRSLDELRTPTITDHGHGVRVYPSSTAGPPYIVNAFKRTCSGNHCQNIVGQCGHLWEDDFRFGQHKGADFVLPPRTTRIREKGTSWSSVDRYLPRPNPVVDGRRYATIAKQARVEMASMGRSVLGCLAHVLRAQATQKALAAGEKAPVGRPNTDLYDLALMAVLRMANDWSYERTQDEINRLAEAGVIQKPFKYPRLNEAMMELPLSGVLLDMADYLTRYFRDVGTVGVMDGMILSTNKTDNANSGYFRANPRSVLTELHVLYEIRWGFIAGFSLTWCARGRGSGEAPQFPFVLHDAKTALPHLRMVQADLAYGSARNFAHALARGITLLVPVRQNAFSKKQSYLTNDQVERLRRTNGPDSPLIQQVHRFRNAVEGWNETQRAVMCRSLKTVPDRSRMPERKVDLKQMKAKPDLAEIELPESDAERAWIIATEQFVGRSCVNEMLCRRVWTLVRAIVKASAYYNQPVDMGFVTPFQPRQEDEAFSIFRPAFEPLPQTE